MEQKTVVEWMFLASTAPASERLPPWRDSSVLREKWIYCCPESRLRQKRSGRSLRSVSLDFVLGAVLLGHRQSQIYLFLR